MFFVLIASKLIIINRVPGCKQKAREWLRQDRTRRDETTQDDTTQLHKTTIQDDNTTGDETKQDSHLFVSQMRYRKNVYNINGGKITKIKVQAI